MDNQKVLWQSKTLWVNVIVALVAFFPQVASQLPPESVAMALSFINIVLRLITKDKIVLKEY